MNQIIAYLILVGALAALNPFSSVMPTAPAACTSRADCQISTQVSPSGEVVCGEVTLCSGVEGAEHGCSVVRVVYGSIESYYEWCDCLQPEDIFDTGPCHSAAWRIGSTNPSRVCRGGCDDGDGSCKLEAGTHTYKRCLCQ